MKGIALAAERVPQPCLTSGVKTHRPAEESSLDRQADIRRPRGCTDEVGTETGPPDSGRRRCNRGEAVGWRSATRTASASFP